ncbi:uncharacterized protein LOC111717508 isoform X3 [Eurytemora carolleeae]|uniref:uncharacterized protein LOC111717508 isoform X3 n=1 Tax=Eurytemora carolleeae TaxID=1294199 RepID=UPI000C779C04|nr:uncharacterized protein LOC111717508 isoform X3 [Eurytemora carolleeae]XP_023348773.1 uncharacterized protein LOC111717508 isoform X3 [Eurytemora carolleeae]|eukprot:XP_023348772.1 uncharacterized protein LOC111717508 isoform X3 [Eurytemora affinis]
MLFLNSLINRRTAVQAIRELSQIPNSERGIKNLTGKTLSKLIRRYSAKFKIDTKDLPNFFNQMLTLDIIYWTGEVRSKDADSIVSWRELMEMKLNPHPHLHSLFLNQLSKYDQDETKYWSLKLGFRTPEIEYLFITQSQEEEVDWDTGELVVSRSEPEPEEIPDNSDELKMCEEKAQYFKLPFSRDRIKIVDSEEILRDCLDILSQAESIGLDGEFSANVLVKNLSLLQLATSESAYLLDMKALSEFQLDPQLWGRLLDIFANPDIKIIGFGIFEDLRLLSRTIPELRDVEEM